MPRQSEATKTMAQKVRDYGRSNKLRYDVAYHLALWANEQDGRPSTGLQADAPTEAELSAEDSAALAAAKAALSA